MITFLKGILCISEQVITYNSAFKRSRSGGKPIAIVVECHPSIVTNQNERTRIQIYHSLRIIFSLHLFHIQNKIHQLLKLFSQNMISIFKKIFKISIPKLPKLFDYKLNMAVCILLTVNNFIIYKYHFTYAAQFIQSNGL